MKNIKYANKLISHSKNAINKDSSYYKKLNSILKLPHPTREIEFVRLCIDQSIDQNHEPATYIDNALGTELTLIH